VTESLERSGALTRNGSGRSVGLGADDARVVRLIRPGSRVLAIGGPSTHLLRELHDRVCDIVLIPRGVPDEERGLASALCSRVIGRPLSIESTLAEIDGAAFDTIVLDGAAATRAGIADLRSIIERALGREGVLIGRLPDQVDAEGSTSYLAGLGLTCVTDAYPSGDRGRAIYAAVRLSADQRTSLELALTDLAAATAEALAARERIAALSSDLARARTEAASAADLLGRTRSDLSQRLDELDRVRQAVAHERAQRRAEVDELTRQLDATHALTLRLGRLESNLNDAAAESAAALSRIADLERELEEAQSETRTRNEAFAATQADLAAAEIELHGLRATIDRLESRDTEWRRLLIDAHEQLAARDDELAAALAGGPDGYLGYRAVVGRVRELARAHIPPGATVAVVSKGDEELLDLDGRIAWHLPSTADGRYSGHHPADGGEAVEQLEALRSRGAQYLILPGSSWWWLDHYPELRAHLERHHETMVNEPGTCLIVDLSERPPAAPDPGADDGYPALVDRVRELARAHIPPGATVAVVSKGDEELLDLDGRIAWHLPSTADGRYSGHHPADGGEAVEQLEALRSRGAQYLILPGSSWWWLDHYPELRAHLERHHETMVNEPGTCLIVDLCSAKALGEDLRRATYEELVIRLRELVAVSVPEGGMFAVASAGDDRLVDLPGRTGRHLPAGGQCAYAGYHPADSVAALAQLEAARAAGARFLVLPETQLWWLDHYEELARHLERRARVTARAPGVGVVYRLSTDRSLGTLRGLAWLRRRGW
jgi:hypothetical protein